MGEVLALDQWYHLIRMGFIHEEDGYGYYATSHGYNKYSNVWNQKAPASATHVVWFSA